MNLHTQIWEKFCVMENMYKWCVPFPLDIALGDWEYKGYFMEGDDAYFNGGDKILNHMNGEDSFHWSNLHVEKKFSYWQNGLKGCMFWQLRSMVKWDQWHKLILLIKSARKIEFVVGLWRCYEPVVFIRQAWVLAVKFPKLIHHARSTVLSRFGFVIKENLLDMDFVMILIPTCNWIWICYEVGLGSLGYYKYTLNRGRHGWNLWEFVLCIFETYC